jgi:hypothetical protein
MAKKLAPLLRAPQPTLLDAAYMGTGDTAIARFIKGGDASAKRRCWTSDELRYVTNWAGTYSVSLLSLHLHRSERALRCKLSRLGISAKVVEGWGLGQLRSDLHLRARAVFRHAIAGQLRVHSAQICAGSCSHCAPGTKTLPLALSARVLGLSRVQVLAAALSGRCRLTNVRITDASVMRLCVSAPFAPIRKRLSTAMTRWLDEETYADASCVAHVTSPRLRGYRG